MADTVDIPNTRKYELGTAIDPNRLFRNFDGTVEELDQGPTSKDLFKMFRNDAQPYQLASALKLPIRRARWDIIAGKNDEGQRDFIEWVLKTPASQGGMTTPMRGVIGKMSNAMLYRFVPFLKVWKVAESGPYKGKVILHKLAYRPPATCKIKSDLNGSFDGFMQEAYKGNQMKPVHVAAKNALVYIHGEDWQPLTGMTPFDAVYKLYVVKRKISFFYHAFLENVAFPKTMVRVDGDDPEQMQHLLNKAKALSSQGIIGLYDDEKIEAYESQRTTRDYQTALEYLDWQMAKACLGQFLDLGTSGERGSFALSKDKSNFFFDSLHAVLLDMEETINNHLIGDLVRFNYGIDSSYPRLKFRPLKDDAAGDILEIYKNVLIAATPNITPPFMLALMNKVEEILDLEINPLSDYDVDDLAMITETIPTAREHLLSREARAGSGQNPITGEDRNENNTTPQDQEPALTAGKQVVSDAISIGKAGAPTAIRTPTRRKRDDRNR